jgi:hypothetical protein
MAAEYILAMGPLESERLLARSGVARAGDARSVGLSVAVELAAEYEQPVYSGGADDARHFVLGDGVVVSSGTRSPAEWAVRMPGFLDEHEYNMLRCAHIAYTRLRLAVGSPATVRTGKGAAAQVGFDLSGDDRERLMKAIYAATEALFASGATRVVPLAFPYVELRPPAGAELLRTQDLELSLTDAFVTGGFGDGVVDADFRVPETRNLRMIDAGLLPTALPAPQLGVMALAAWAATRML